MKHYFIRGGSWFSIARDCRASYRHIIGPDDRIITLGFRLTKKLKQWNTILFVAVAGLIMPDTATIIIVTTVSQSTATTILDSV